MKKTNSFNVKKAIAAVLSAVVVVSGVSGVIPTIKSGISVEITASAASSFRKCYTITTNNKPVYSNTGLTSKIGSVYPSDEIYVNNVTNAYTHITYPISGNRTKSGYIRTSAILTGVNGIATKTATGKCTTYKRPSGGSYGSVYKGDKCVVLGTSNGMVQIKYPVSGGYKYAFITSDSAESYLGYGASPSPTPTTSTKYYVTTTSGLNLRSKASTSGSLLVTMPYGSTIQVYSISNGWAYCTYNGKTGYCSSQYISKNQPNSTSKENLSKALYKNSSARITCGFDGYNTTKGRHEGIDFSLYNGAAVYSLTDGVVTRVTYGSRGSNGLSTIAIYNQSTNKTIVYLHSSPVTLRVGQSISKGQKIATQDWRGVSSSSGGHTHVEVRNGRQTSAAKSVNDYKLDNSNPTSFWNSMGYNVK